MKVLPYIVSCFYLKLTEDEREEEEESETSSSESESASSKSTESGTEVSSFSCRFMYLFFGRMCADKM